MSNKTLSSAVLVSLLLGTGLAQAEDAPTTQPGNSAYQQQKLEKAPASQQTDEIQDPDSQFKLSVGEMAPRKYRTSSYVLKDYKKHDLPAPGDGNVWSKVGNNYVEIENASGNIIRIIKGR